MIPIFTRLFFILIMGMMGSLGCHATPFQAMVTSIAGGAFNFQDGLNQYGLATIKVNCHPTSRFSITLSSEFGRYFILKDQYTGRPGEMAPFSVQLLNEQATNTHYSALLGRILSLDTPAIYDFTSTASNQKWTGVQHYLLTLHAPPNTTLFSGSFVNRIFINIVEQP